MKVQIEAISYFVGSQPKHNGENFNWMGQTKGGEEISLYYDVSRPTRELETVEAYDPSGVLGLRTSHDVVAISIMDLPKYFKARN